jgi:membrane protease YdiL (CAAX protease family)
MSGKNRPRWLIPLLAAVSIAFLIGLGWSIHRLVEAPDIPTGLKISGIAASAGGCLLLALAWLWPVLRRQRKRQPLNVIELLLLVYLFPILALIVPLRLVGALLPSAEVTTNASSWLRPGPPWLLLIQGGLLAAALLPRRKQALEDASEGPTHWILAILAGTGTWLLSAFIFSFLARGAGPAGLPEPLPAASLFVLAVFSALVILPLGEEFFFRRLLPETILRVWPRLNAAKYSLFLWIVTSAMFATLQARPLLWLPAFCLSLGLSALAEHTGRLRECILAHAVFNLLALALNWATIV